MVLGVCGYYISPGAGGGNMRNIAMGTVVTLLVDNKDKNANGLVGAVGGIGFICY